MPNCKVSLSCGLHAWLWNLCLKETGESKYCCVTVHTDLSSHLCSLSSPSWTSQRGDPAAWCQLAWPEGAERGQRRWREETTSTGRRYWAAVVLLSGKHAVYPQHHPLSSSCIPVSVSVSLFVWLSYPSPAVDTTANIWVTAAITLCHDTKMLTSNSSHFLGKHTHIQVDAPSLSALHTHTNRQTYWNLLVQLSLSPFLALVVTDGLRSVNFILKSVWLERTEGRRNSGK